MTDATSGPVARRPPAVAADILRGPTSPGPHSHRRYERAVSGSPDGTSRVSQPARAGQRFSADPFLPSASVLLPSGFSVSWESFPLT